MSRRVLLVIPVQTRKPANLSHGSYLVRRSHRLLDRRIGNSLELFYQILSLDLRFLPSNSPSSGQRCGNLGVFGKSMSFAVDSSGSHVPGIVGLPVGVRIIHAGDKQVGKVLLLRG